jgi:nucleotide-binding universal stress UspA family protein
MSGTPHPFRRIVVAVDFDEQSAAALRAASALADAYGADLTVLHAASIDMPPYFTEAQADRLENERAEARERCGADVRAFASTHVKTPITVTIEEGPAADVILRLAEDFDLVVLGTHRRRAATRWMLGSVAEAVVRAAQVPVLVVPLERTPS